MNKQQKFLQASIAIILFTMIVSTTYDYFTSWESPDKTSQRELLKQQKTVSDNILLHKEINQLSKVLSTMQTEEVIIRMEDKLNRAAKYQILYLHSFLKFLHMDEGENIPQKIRAYDILRRVHQEHDLDLFLTPKEDNK